MRLSASIPTLALSTALLVATSSTARADTPYHPGDRIPYGYHVETGGPSGVLIGGTIGFGLAYGIAAIGGATEDRARELLLPFTGPLYVGYEPEKKANILTRSLLILDSIGQMAGFSMIIVGLAVGERHVLAPNSRRNPRAPAPLRPNLRVAPTGMANGAGLIATGTF